jgi:excisionase family DNA binding protein
MEQDFFTPDQHRHTRRAMAIEEFCKRYGLGRTRAYEEIKCGRLRARKCGKRTLIAHDDAEDWLERLPVVKTNSAPAPQQHCHQGKNYG